MTPLRALMVLDLGEVIEDETGRLVASFDPTPENIQEWEERVTIINEWVEADESLMAAARERDRVRTLAEAHRRAALTPEQREEEDSIPF